MSAEGSLILGDGSQLALLAPDKDGVPDAAYAPAESRGRFTGERLFSNNPKLYSAISKLLARSIPHREIADICSVSVNTIAAVARREGVTIESQKQEIGSVALQGARMTAETIVERLADPAERDRVSLKDLAIIHGILAERSQLLLGGATVRIEQITGPQPAGEDYLALLRNATPVETRFGSGIAGPKGADSAGPGGAVVEAESAGGLEAAPEPQK